MENFKDKNNNEILLTIKQLQLDHEALKMQLLKGVDKLIAIEEEYEKANQIILERLTGSNNVK